MGFEFKEHTADIKIVSKGNTLEDAFRNCIFATCNILCEDISTIKKTKEFAFELESIKLERLLYDFLEEIIYILDSQNVLICDIKDLKIEKKTDKYSLKGTFLGDKIKNYKTNGDIKAVTYNEMSIKKIGNIWQIEFVYDI